MIFTALSPNTQKDDFDIARRLVFKPQDYENGAEIEELRTWFASTLDVMSVVLYESARTGLFFLLKELGVGKGDEVVLQAFTCVAAVNPIKWTGAKPIYVDVNPGTYNLDLNDLANKVNERTKAILVQHTFGYPAEIEKILDFAKTNGLFIIEDCAHTIGGMLKGKPLGSFGDGAVFSLGRDKGISSSFGGVVATKRKLLGQKLIGQEKFLAYPSKSWIRKQLLYTVTSFLTRKYYDTLSLGKLIHLISFKLGLVSRSTEQVEKRTGAFPRHAKSRMPNAFAKTALNQLHKLETINLSRLKISRLYMKSLAGISGVKLPGWELADGIFPLRFPLLVEKRDELVEYLSSRGVLAGDWYDVPVAPKDVDLLAASYQQGSCPNAESVSRSVVNLPVNVNMSESDTEKVIRLVRGFFG
ncbi:MAG: DegT/DnrJ/EryC1/StrS family aminotransferase [Patescibacteria group bacterium]|nr:aminotransferase class I/II-fold pyridoxal phosphate-dependent enzyme [Patescibacteria group bacterium]